MNKEFIYQKIKSGSETKNCEFKEWIDPSTNTGKSKIVKGCLAIYNANGGHLIVGTTDDGSPVPKQIDDELIKKFDTESIQSIISNFSSEHIDVDVDLLEINDGFIVVISIPSGAKAPTACKRDLLNDKNQLLLKVNAVYFRTYNANNLISSAEIQYRDWPLLLEPIFINREVQFADFLRRHFKGRPDNFGLATTHFLPKENTLKRMTDLRSDFFAMCRDHNVIYPDYGFQEYHASIDNDSIPQLPDQAFIRNILNSNPELTGWPFWCNSFHYRDTNARPFVIEKSWRSFLNYTDGDLLSELDFWDINSNKNFYCIRALQEDVKSAKKIGFDPDIAIYRCLEAIAIIKAFTNVIVPDGAEIQFSTRYFGLKNRRFTSITGRGIWYGQYKSNTDAFFNEIVLYSKNTREEDIESAFNLLTPLFSLFDGTRIEINRFQDLSRQLYSH